jgi:hypothetical protein
MNRTALFPIVLALTVLPSLAMMPPQGLTPTPEVTSQPSTETIPLEDVWTPTQKLTEAQKKFLTEDQKAIQERQDLLSFRDNYLEKATPKSQQEAFGKSEAEGLKVELITDVNDPNVGKQVLVSPDMKDFVFISMNDNWKNQETVNNAADGIQLVEAENYSKIIRKTNDVLFKKGFIPLNSELFSMGDELVFVKDKKVVANYIPQYEKIWPVFNQNAEREVSFDLDGKVMGKLQKAYYLSSEESKNAEYDIVKMVNGKEVRYPIPPAKENEEVLMLQFTTNTVNMMPFVEKHNKISTMSDDPNITMITFSNFESYPSNDKDISGFIEYAIPVPKDLDVKGIAVRGADGTAVRIWDSSQSKPEVITR